MREEGRDTEEYKLYFKRVHSTVHSIDKHAVLNKFQIMNIYFN